MVAKYKDKDIDFPVRTKEQRDRYINNLKSLYTDAKPQISPTARKLFKGSDNPYAFEHDEQVRVCVWMDRNRILYYAVPNSAKRSGRQGAYLKAEGMKAGVPDLVIPMARNGFHGLYIELKRKRGGHLLDSQRYWQEALLEQNYQALVCKGADAAIAALQEYFGIK